MQQRLPIVLSSTALLVALFGSTPLGNAVTAAIPPFAKKAGHARTAGYSKYSGNAATVHGIKAARTPRPGFLVPLGADGKFPASVGQAGPKGDTGPAGAPGGRGDKGDKGDKGDTGAPGVSGVELVITPDPFGSTSMTERQAIAECPDGKMVVGGGADIIGDGAGGPAIIGSRPLGNPALKWIARAREIDAFAGNWSLIAYAICAKVS